MALKCSCGHTNKQPYPAFPKAVEKKSKQVSKNEKLSEMLPPEMFKHIFSFLSVKMLDTVSKTCTLFRDICQNVDFNIRRNICCFHTKMNSEEALLGIGLYVEYNGKNVASVSTPMDIISHFAFNKMGLRKGAWNEYFTHFFPLCKALENSLTG